MNKNKPRRGEENQKGGSRRSNEKINMFYLVNEKIKESCENEATRFKQRETAMREAMREADANFLSDCDSASKKRSSSINSDSDSSEDRGSTEDLDSFKDLPIYVKEESKRNTKKIRCDFCDQE